MGVASLVGLEDGRTPKEEYEIMGSRMWEYEGWVGKDTTQCEMANDTSTASSDDMFEQARQHRYEGAEVSW